MKIGTLINNGTINDMQNAHVVITSQGINVVQQIKANPDNLCFDNLPPKLQSPRAQAIWRILFQEGYVDHKCITTRSRTESAIIAKNIAEKLGLKRYWNDFSELWQMPNLKSSYGKSFDTQSGWDIDKELKRILQ